MIKLTGLSAPELAREKQMHAPERWYSVTGPYFSAESYRSLARARKAISDVIQYRAKHFRELLTEDQFEIVTHVSENRIIA